MNNALTEASVVRDFLIQFSELFEPIAMLLVFLLAISAFKASKKKIYLLLILTSLVLAVGGIVGQIDQRMREKHQLSLSCVILGRDQRTNLPSEAYRALMEDQQKLQLEYENDAFSLEKKHMDKLDLPPPNTNWIGELWGNLLVIFQKWILPIVLMLLCMADAKSGKGGFSLFKRKK